jgi:hypothetical protein
MRLDYAFARAGASIVDESVGGDDSFRGLSDHAPIFVSVALATA